MLQTLSEPHQCKHCQDIVLDFNEDSVPARDNEHPTLRVDCTRYGALTPIPADWIVSEAGNNCALCIFLRSLGDVDDIKTWFGLGGHRFEFRAGQKVNKFYLACETS